jgi:hypothetical protein
MKGTLKKRMDKDGWFVVFQSDAYNESDMAYELLKSQEIDIDMYDVYKDGDEVTFEVVRKKYAKITPFLYPFEWEGCDGCTEQDEVMYKNGYAKGYNAAISELPKEISDDRTKLHWKTSLVVHTPEISDEEIQQFTNNKSIFKDDMYRTYFIMGATWYREQLKTKK